MIHGPLQINDYPSENLEKPDNFFPHFYASKKCETKDLQDMQKVFRLKLVFIGSWEKNDPKNAKGYFLPLSIFDIKTEKKILLFERFLSHRTQRRGRRTFRGNFHC